MVFVVVVVVIVCDFYNIVFFVLVAGVNVQSGEEVAVKLVCDLFFSRNLCLVVGIYFSVFYGPCTYNSFLGALKSDLWIVFFGLIIVIMIVIK